MKNAKKKRKRKPPKDSIFGKGASGLAKSFHKPKTDTGVRQRRKYGLNDYTADQQK